LRTGDCKFGLAFRYHHPSDHIMARPLLNPIGLPLRPVCGYSPDLVIY